jgi:hypothetical protein
LQLGTKPEAETGSRGAEIIILVQQSNRPAGTMPIKESEMMPNQFPLVFGGLLLGLLYYGLIFFCVWKFYQVLSNINDNLAGINRTIAGLGRFGTEASERMSGPASPDAANHDTPLRAQQCPGCGLRVLPTAEGRCPSCQTPIE